MQGAILSVLLFLALWGLAFLICLLAAPAKIDRELRASHLVQTKELNAIIQNRDLVIAQKREELAQKNPHDETREKIVRDLLIKLDKHSNAGRGFLGWLLTNGTSDESEIFKANFHPNMAAHVMAEAQPHSVVKRILHPSANGQGEIGASYEINVQFQLAVRNVLFPGLSRHDHPITD